MSLAVTSPPHTLPADGAQVAVQAAPSLATSVQQLLVQEYACARQQYKQSHAQYSARVASTGPSRFDQFCNGAFRDIFFYTSATDPATCCEPAMCSHGSRRAGLHELNHQLRLRARERLRAAVPKRENLASDVFALLVQQEAAEQADLLELEAAGFVKLARAYYDGVYGPSNQLFSQEAQSRRQIEDAVSHATMALVGQLREELWRAEQRLLLRAYNMCPDVLPHHAQLRAVAASQEMYERAHVLDSKDAVPLWHRACVIRGETESEEDINFRRLTFACVVQAHAMEDNLLIRDAATGCLRRTSRRVPDYMQDAVDYALQFEQFALVLREETQRMAVMDAAAALWSDQ